MIDIGGYGERVPQSEGFFDWLGNTLNEGDKVVYATRTGSNMNMVLGYIHHMYVSKAEHNGDTKKRLLIQPLREGTHGYQHDVHRKPLRNVSLKYVTKV